MIGQAAELFISSLLMTQAPQGILFNPLFIGGNFPTIDIYAEIITPSTPVKFCFFQVKATERGYTRGGKLQVVVEKNAINRLSSFLAPTYLIGVDWNAVNPPNSRAYIQTIKGAYNTGKSSMSTNFVLNAANLIILKDEVLAFWDSTNTNTIKQIYTSHFL